MKPLVVFFTREGSTRILAQAAAEKLQCATRELVDTKERKSMPSAAFSALLRWKAKLQNPDFSTEGFDLLVLMTPIWASNLPPAMNTFLAKAPLQGKNVVLVGVGAGNANPNALEKFQGVAKKKGANVVAALDCLGIQLMKETASEQEDALKERGTKLGETILEKAGTEK